MFVTSVRFFTLTKFHQVALKTLPLLKNQLVEILIQCVESQTQRPRLSLKRLWGELTEERLPTCERDRARAHRAELARQRARVLVAAVARLPRVDARVVLVELEVIAVARLLRRSRRERCVRTARGARRVPLALSPIGEVRSELPNHNTNQARGRVIQLTIKI